MINIDSSTSAKAYGDSSSGKATSQADAAKARQREFFENFFCTDTYKGIPVTPLMAEVIREMNGELQPTVGPATVYTVNPKRVTVPTALDVASAELVKKAGAAPDLATAFAVLKTVPALQELTAKKPVFIYFKDLELRSPTMAAIGAGRGMQRHYGNTYQIVADAKGFRAVLEQQFAYTYAYDSQWGRASQTAYQKRISDKWYDVLAWSSKRVATEFELTPRALAEGVLKLLTTGSAKA